MTNWSFIFQFQLYFKSLRFNYIVINGITDSICQEATAFTTATFEKYFTICLYVSNMSNWKSDSNTYDWVAENQLKNIFYFREFLKDPLVLLGILTILIQFVWALNWNWSITYYLHYGQRFLDTSPTHLYGTFWASHHRYSSWFVGVL